MAFAGPLLGKYKHLSADCKAETPAWDLSRKLRC